MNVLRCLATLALALPAAAPGLHAQAADAPSRPPLSLELSTDMLRFDQPGTRLFLGWHRDLNELFRAGLDASTDALALRRPGAALPRLALLAVFAGANTVARRAFSITAHDAAHMEAALAIGATRAWLVRSTDTSQEMGIGEFLLESFNPLVEPGLYTWAMSAGATPTAAQEAYVAGEGLDTNLAIAQAIAARMDSGEGQVLDVAPYVLNKLWGVSYFLETGPTSDAQDYLDQLARQGFTVTSTQVIALQAVSFLVSGGSLGLARGTVAFVADARTSVDPIALRVGDALLCWPEMSAWLNPDNVSVQLSSRLRWSSSLLSWVGLDVPVLGAAGNPELTVGSGVRLGPLRVQGELTARSLGVPFVKGGAELAVGEVGAVGVEGFYGQGTTMRERREYPAGPGAAAYIRARL